MNAHGFAPINPAALDLPPTEPVDIIAYLVGIDATDHPTAAER